MTALSLLSSRNNSAALAPAFNPSDFGDVVGAQFDNIRQNFTTDAEIRNIGDPLYKRNNLLKERIGRDIHDLTGMNEKYPNPTARGRVRRAKEANQAIDDIITRGRTEEPDLWTDIKTTAEIEEEGRQKARDAKIKYEGVAARNTSGFSRISGSLVGGVGGAMTDPLNIATLPLGAGSLKVTGSGAFSFSRALVAQAAKEGSIQAAVELASIPQIAKWQNEVGHKYGLAEAAQDVGFAFVGGAALRGAAEGIVPAVRGTYKGVENVNAYVLDKISQSPNLPRTVKDSLKYMSRKAYVDEATPVPVRTRKELEQHRARVEEVSDDVESYRAPAVKNETKEKPAQIAPVNQSVIELKNNEFDFKGQSKVYTSDVFAKKQKNTPKDVQDISDKYIDNTNRVPLQEVPINQIVPTQRFLYADNLDKVSNATKDTGAFLVKDGEDYFLMDGHHRIASNLVKGEGVVNAHVVDLASSNKKQTVTEVKAIKNTADETGVIDRDAHTATEYRPKRPEPPNEPSPETLSQAARSQFDELVEGKSNDMIDLEDGTRMTMKEFAEKIKADENMLSAITTCRIA